jgi:hypothetical protein
VQLLKVARQAGKYRELDILDPFEGLLAVPEDAVVLEVKLVATRGHRHDLLIGFFELRYARLDHEFLVAASRYREY